MASAGAHTHSRGTMEISGWFNLNKQEFQDTPSGAFTLTGPGPTRAYAANGAGRSGNFGQMTFTASRSWKGATSSNGAHTHDLTITKNTGIYGQSDTVQPAALKIRVKTKAK